MCGHVGIAGDLAHKDEATMRRLLILDYFRGPDSTGMAGISHTGEAKIAKLKSNPCDLFEMSSFKAALSGSGSKAFIGHNRLATRGVVNNNNAHPFHFDHIIGAHNGTLETKDKWALEDAIGEKFDVDSQALFAAIAKLGVDTVIPMLTSSDISSNSSAWALVWYDQSDGTLNFLRNQHRPLWFGYEEGFKKLFWASEWQTIQSAVNTEVSPYKMYVETKSQFKYWPFVEDTHYKFNVNELKKGVGRPKPRVKVLKGKEPVKASYGTTGDSNPFARQNRGTGDTSTDGGKKSTTSTMTSRGQLRIPSEDKKPAFLHMLGDVGSPFAGWLSRTEFEEMAKYGCCWCSEPVLYEDPGVTVYDRDQLVLCAGCSGHKADDKGEPATRIYVKAAAIDAYM